MICLLDKQIAEYMVKMQMCIKQQFDCEIVIAYECGQFFSLTRVEAARVDYCGLKRVIPNNIGIDWKEVEFKALDLHHICT